MHIANIGARFRMYPSCAEVLSNVGPHGFPQRLLS
jgi:hypothetical protein